MQARVLTILVCGPALSGRATTLRQIVALAKDGRGNLGPPRLPELTSVKWKSSGQDLDVRLAMIRAVSNFRFEDLGEIRRKPWVEAEFELLASCDGLFIVLDLQVEMKNLNFSFLNQLKRWLSWCNRDLEKIPAVYLLNKGDLPNSRSAATLATDLGLESDYFHGVSIEGTGVDEAFRRLVELCLGE